MIFFNSNELSWYSDKPANPAKSNPHLHTIYYHDFTNYSWAQEKDTQMARKSKTKIVNVHKTVYKVVQSVCHPDVKKLSGFACSFCAGEGFNSNLSVRGAPHYQLLHFYLALTELL